MASWDLSFLFSIFFDFTSHAGLHEAHHIFKTFLLETRRAQVGAPTTDGFFWFRIGASEFAGRADVEAGPAQSADLRVGIEGSTEVPFLSPAAKADGFGHHLLFTHPDASSAEDAVLVFLFETLRMDIISRSKVLNRFRLRARGKKQFKDHLAGLYHSR